MKATKIKDNIYWVGAVDWNVRNFHGYLTQRGTTYNAYLIIDEKITLIDTVKPVYTDEMIRRISSVIDPSKIDYIISNHVEMDHSGALPGIMRIAKDAVVIASPHGVKGLKAHYGDNWNFLAKSTGDTLNAGKMNMSFVLTPMVHWPDNMIVYLQEEKLVFSNDGLGQHLASSERIDDEYPLDIIMEEAKKYYANIVLPYSKQVKKVLEVVSGLEIDMIAPSHGIIWNSNVDKIIKAYGKWSTNNTREKAIIIYDTMWGSTEIMANAIKEVFDDYGIHTSMRNLVNHHMSDIMTELIDAKYICVGSPTLNSTMMPSVAGFLTYMSGLAPQGRKAISFGSYGWGGRTIEDINSHFEKSGFDIILSKKIKYIPDNTQLEGLRTELKEKIDSE